MKTMFFRTLTRLAGLCFCFTLISICLTSCGSEPAERISIATLQQAEQQNEDAAYNKYNGKKLAITGRVDKISSGIFLDSSIWLKDGEGRGFMCYFKDESEFDKVTNGQVVTIVGKYDNGRLERCRIY